MSSRGGRPYGTRPRTDIPYRPPLPLPEAPGHARVLARVPLDLHAKLHQMAASAGVSASYMVALLIEHAELDHRGLPPWAPSPVTDQLELSA
jgi:hypothetical protein